jgi:hypothetical protein
LAFTTARGVAVDFDLTLAEMIGEWICYDVSGYRQAGENDGAVSQLTDDLSMYAPYNEPPASGGTASSRGSQVEELRVRAGGSGNPTVAQVRRP